MVSTHHQCDLELGLGDCSEGSHDRNADSPESSNESKPIPTFRLLLILAVAMLCMFQANPTGLCYTVL